MRRERAPGTPAVVCSCRTRRTALTPTPAPSRPATSATRSARTRVGDLPHPVIDEIGYLPLERQAANLLFALIARRYERGSIIVTSNRGFEAWGEILGDAMVAAALIDRLVHHATMVTLKGRSYVKHGTEIGASIRTVARAEACSDGTCRSFQMRRARWRLRQRSASVRLLPSACLRCR